MTRVILAASTWDIQLGVICEEMAKRYGYAVVQRSEKTNYMSIRPLSLAIATMLVLTLSVAASAAGLDDSLGGLTSQPEIIAWLKKELSDGDIAALSRDDLKISGDVCSCSDLTPHYPYAVLKISVKNSAFIARVEGNEAGFRLRPIAVQRDNKYFLHDGDEIYFGEYNSTCEFTDARFGPTLAPFFPDCKASTDESEPPSR